MMWIVDADTLIDTIKDMSILIDGYIEKSDDYIRTVKCSECEYLKVHNTEALYAFCPKFGIEFYPFENDTRKHGCSWGKPKGRTLVQADRKTEPTDWKDQMWKEAVEDEPQTELVKDSQELVKGLVEDAYICDTCKHFDKEQFSEACDKCFGDHNNWQPKTEPQTDCPWK